jgi:hypothetical protein
MDLPLAIAEKLDTSKLVAARYGFDERQSNYYLEAAEVLGLISKRSTKYRLTEDGKKYLLMDISERKLTLVRRMVLVPIITRVIAELMVKDKNTVSKQDLERLIAESSPVKGSTVPRRAQTIISWFRWLSEETDVIQATADSVTLKCSYAIP